MTKFNHYHDPDCYQDDPEAYARYLRLWAEEEERNAHLREPFRTIVNNWSREQR